MKKLFLAFLLLWPITAVAAVVAPIPYNAPTLTNTAVTLKATAGVLQWGVCYDPNVTVEYVQVYDLATAVTVGTTTPTMAIALTPSTVTIWPGPANMLKAIKLAATTTATGGSAPGTALACTFGFN